MAKRMNAELRKEIDSADIVYVMVNPAWDEEAYWVPVTKAAAKGFCTEADINGVAIQRFWSEEGNGLVLGY